MNTFITGTSSGLGHALSRALLDKGNTVFGISRKSSSDLEKNANFRFLPLDLSDFDAVKAKIPGFIKNIEIMDLVVLNAGILNEIKDLKDTSLTEIKKAMDVNVWSNKILIDLLIGNIPEIKQIVAISSGAAVSGARGWNAYSLSKATLNMLIDLYAKEQPDIHFCALAPGLVDTNMQDYIYQLPDNDKYPVVKKLKNAKGTSQMPSPDETAPLLLKAFEIVNKYDSGAFLDVRDLYFHQ